MTLPRFLRKIKFSAEMLKQVATMEEAQLSDYANQVLLKHRELIEKNGYRKGYLTVNLRRKGESKWTNICKNVPNIVPNTGRDWVHDQLYINTAAGDQGANYIALTVDPTGTDVLDTTLPGEINNSTGLNRALASTRTHTTGTNLSTLQHTFSATATHTNVQMSGLLNAASAGDFAHEDTFTPVTLNSGDDLQVTWDLTAG